MNAPIAARAVPHAAVVQRRTSRQLTLTLASSSRCTSEALPSLAASRSFLSSGDSIEACKKAKGAHVGGAALGGRRRRERIQVCARRLVRYLMVSLSQCVSEPRMRWSWGLDRAGGGGSAWASRPPKRRPRVFRNVHADSRWQSPLFTPLCLPASPLGVGSYLPRAHQATRFLRLKAHKLLEQATLVTQRQYILTCRYPTVQVRTLQDFRARAPEARGKF